MIAQLIYDTLAKKRPGGLRSKLIAQLAVTGRRVLLKAGDPLVTYEVGGTPIQIPLSHNLGVYYRNDPYYSLSLASVAKAVHDKYPEMTFIDVGANVGDTIPLLRSKAHFPVLAIEGDPSFYSTLELNTRAFADVTNVKRFLGDADPSDAELSFVSGKGTGRLERAGAIGDGDPASNVVRLDDLLEEYPAFAQSRMLKIDTDGFDAKVIRGALRWLQQVKPVLFFEYTPHYWEEHGEDCVSVFSLLEGAGYAKFIVFMYSGEFLCSADIGNQAFIEELRVMHKKQFFYCDVCVFAAADLDLFEQVRDAELAANLARSRW
jgi:FkbM family methyltransferase